MDTHERKELVARFFAAIVNRDIEAIDSLITDDIRDHFPFGPDTLPRTVSGRAQLLEWFDGLFKGIKSFALHDVEMHVAEESGLLFAFARSEAEFQPARHYANRYVFVFRFHENRIAEMWEYSDPAPVIKLFAG